MVLALMGLGSGILSAGSYFLIVAFRGGFGTGIIILVVPGALFGLAVMIPFRSVVSAWWTRMALVVLISSGAHALAMSQIFSGDRGFSTAGAIGALIVGKGILVVLGHPWRYRVLGLMVMLGGIGILSARYAWFGYLIWQPIGAAPLGGLLAELRAAKNRPGGPEDR